MPKAREEVRISTEELDQKFTQAAVDSSIDVQREFLKTVTLFRSSCKRDHMCIGALFGTPVFGNCRSLGVQVPKYDGRMTQKATMGIVLGT